MCEASFHPHTAEAHVAYNANEYCPPPSISNYSYQERASAAHRLAPHYAHPGQGGHIRSHIQHSPNGGAPESCTQHCRQVLGSHGGTPGVHNRFPVADPCGGDMMPGMVAGRHPLGGFTEMNTVGSQMSPQGGNLIPHYHGGASMAGTQCMPSPVAPRHCRSAGLPVNFGQLSPMEASRAPYGHPQAHTYAGQHCPAYSTPLENTNGYDRQVFRSPPVMSQGKVFPDYGGHYSEYSPHLEEQYPQQCEGRLPEQASLMLKTEPEVRPEGELQEVQPIKLPRKRDRNSDKRKEQSRNAARNRRGKESEIFAELASVLPLPAQTINQLDKASIMRLTIAKLDLRAVVETGLTKRVKGSGGSKLDQEMDEHHLKALDGFLLVVSTDGRVIYTSENIATFLGHQQEEVMGSSLYHYTNMVDHSEVEQLTSFKNPHQPRRAFLRLKCTLTSKGRSVNFKNATDKVVQVIGEVVGERAEKAWLVALAIPVPHPSNIEFPLDKQTFVSRHSLDMKFTYVDNNVREFCGYVSEELVGRSVYELHHALDTMLIQEAYKNLLSKGQVETSRYRFLARGGGYVWLVTQATLIHGPRENKPQYVVCLNYVVSEVESREEILSEFQLMCSSSSSSNNSETNNNDNEEDVASTNSKASLKCAPVNVPVASPVLQGLPTPPYSPAPKSNIAQKVSESAAPRGTAAPLPPPPPVASTFKIFVPRTKDMNKGFLTFNDNDPHSTVLKDEPEDLTHLAPSGGDTCVPLPILKPEQEEDSCMPQDVTTFMPCLDDMLTIDCPVPVLNSDAVIQCPNEVKTEARCLSPRYLYEENQIEDGVKCMNSLSGGRLLLNRSRCNTPSSDCNSVHSGGLGTPEPPKPLLSEAALPQPIKKQSPISFGSSHPRTITESLFMPLDESNSGGSSELFGRLDLKFDSQNMDSDEFEMRAPYIPPSNELLLFLDHEELFPGAEPEIAISPKCLRDGKFSISGDKDDSSLAQLLRDTDPNIAGSSPGRNIQLDHSPGSQRSQYQNKFLDGGGNFVDPNKVLPGHFAGKDELDSIGSDSQLVDPPPVLVQEPVEPPPPLLSTDSHHTSGQVKRGHSPLSSPTLHHKKLCSPKCQQPPQKFPERSQDAVNQHQQNQQQGGLRLFTPHAPTMQQLLISKDPITVRGGRPPAGGTSASRNLHTDKSHSVLRNLLNPNDDNSIVLEEVHGRGLPSTTAFRLPKDRMAAMLLTTTGGKSGTSLSYPTLRLVTGGPGSLKQAFKLTSNSSSHPEGCGSRLGQRQDPCLLMSSDTIPTLLELTQQDYEVNAPANSSLLQGAELLMALDQSSEAALLDGK